MVSAVQEGHHHDHVANAAIMRNRTPTTMRFELPESAKFSKQVAMSWSRNGIFGREDFG